MHDLFANFIQQKLIKAGFPSRKVTADTDTEVANLKPDIIIESPQVGKIYLDIGISWDPE